MVEAVEAISEVCEGNITAGIALLGVALATIIQVSPIKLDPWTWLARWIGRAINGELIEKVDKLEKKIERMDHDAGEQRAKDARARVLRFGDEILHNDNDRHSKEHFDDILQDITEYEKYCEEHPEFENNRMQLTAQKIKDTYKKCWEEHRFL